MLRMNKDKVPTEEHHFLKVKQLKLSHYQGSVVEIQSLYFSGIEAKWGQVMKL